MIKKHGKWIGLGMAAMPIIWFALPASLFSSPSVSSVAPSMHDSQPPPIRIQTPNKQPVIAFELDSAALEVIRKSKLIGNAKLDAQLAAEQAKEREASKRGRQSKGNTTVPNITVLGGGNHYRPTSSTNASTASQDVLSRLKLNALITAANGNTFAYLSIDNDAPVQVTTGSRYKGALISAITPTDVTVTKGKERRVLLGGRG